MNFLTGQRSAMIGCKVLHKIFDELHETYEFCLEGLFFNKTRDGCLILVVGECFCDLIGLTKKTIKSTPDRSNSLREKTILQIRTQQTWRVSKRFVGAEFVMGLSATSAYSRIVSLRT